MKTAREMVEVGAQLAGCYVYPIKGCRAIRLAQAELRPTGLAHDREWLLIQPDGMFITQRTHPRLALIEVELQLAGLRVSRPDGASFLIPFQLTGESRQVRIWRDRCTAIDLGAAAAEWFSDFLGSPLRLVRFSADAERLSEARFTAGVPAPVMFADGYAVLVTVEASLSELNRQLPAPVPMNRFRPNLVLDGVPAYAEDRIDRLAFGDTELRLVKPCLRCVVTTTDQLTAEVGIEPLRTLSERRWNRELHGAMFGVNAIVTRPGPINSSLPVTIGWRD